MQVGWQRGFDFLVELAALRNAGSLRYYCDALTVSRLFSKGTGEDVQREQHEHLSITPLIAISTRFLACIAFWIRRTEWLT